MVEELKKIQFQRFEKQDLNNGYFDVTFKIGKKVGLQF